MGNRKRLDPDSGPMAAYGARLRRLREERGWTQEELATRTGYSSKHISGVEIGGRPSTLRFSGAVDAAFGLTGTERSFDRECRQVRHGVLLEGFPEYVAQERKAVEIRLFTIGVIPGLVQTPEYARTVTGSFVSRGAATAEQAAERVAYLMERQKILEQERPPMLFVVMDESCLRRPVGGSGVMAAQLDRLMEFAERPNTVVQVAPFALGERRPLDLPLYLLTLPDRSVISYAESQSRGHLERENGAVSSMLTAYHQLAAESLSQADTVTMIKEVRKGML
ncbi:transcriptional regulator [Streptomyces hydrogenans]|uniref:Transcriptional regulator n=2 Tax=Streptomyces hydrogenans TaxID=1873719 RepID=A0ABQ3PMY2_9ACTN|nr:helix-turn-helix transcriptional regulator [Streptomyces hydrogenans]GHG10534.1 transcriptional regulator [Streptomyces hydrogenans]GHI26377.1 transcriptional regulator [Streptomyces hydrogenans]